MKDALKKPSFFVNMEKEMVELTGKLNRLEKFITTNENFLKLSDDRRYLLKRQLVPMKEYQAILQERIELETVALQEKGNE